MTLPEYLQLHEGMPWKHEDSAYVLAHVAEIERTYRAMIEQSLEKVEAAVGSAD